MRSASDERPSRPRRTTPSPAPTAGSPGLDDRSLRSLLDQRRDGLDNRSLLDHRRPGLDDRSLRSLLDQRGHGLDQRRHSTEGTS
ncbi:hypothetical protein [Nocardioides psychrotolerans]|uniref:hypothetical protein n=1 Tax=Nocardioides psychrotolerans TaxID=1005945 RepID=UPI003137D02B